MRFVVCASVRPLAGEKSAGLKTAPFVLPPLTFVEFLGFSKFEGDVLDTSVTPAEIKDMDRLNAAFLAYINYGGLPETARSKRTRTDAVRFTGNEVIEGVVLRDVANRHGVGHISDLKQLLTVLALNTGVELTFEDLVFATGLSKNTLRKFMDYLEAAFLIVRADRVDKDAKPMQRVRNFKTYLTYPSLRAQLFGPVGVNDPAMGQLAEAAFFAQYAHTGVFDDLHYARWGKYEISMVFIDIPSGTPWDASQITWSDDLKDMTDAIRGLAEFSKMHNIENVLFSTRKTSKAVNVDDTPVFFEPVAAMCLGVDILGQGE